MNSYQNDALFLSNDTHTIQTVIKLILNNWTALRLAVEHGMGGSPALTQTKLQNIVECIVKILQELSLEKVQANTDWHKVSDILEMKMDFEFSTILEDNSCDEVAVHIGYLFKLYRSGDIDSLNSSLELLPRPSPIFVNKPENARFSNNPIDLGEKESEQEAGHSTEEGWMTVKRR